MKTKKEIAKKTKTAARKTSSKVRTVSAVKKIVKKPARNATHSVAGGTKIAAAPKKVIKKHKTIAAEKFSYEKMLAGTSFRKISHHRIGHGLKRTVYMLLALAVGILSAGFILGLLEKIYLENSFKMGLDPVANQFLGMQLFLLPIAYVSIFVAGLLFGTWLGFWGWRVVYIEKRHRMYRNN